MAEATAGPHSPFDELTSWANLQRAARKTRLGKRRQPAVARFELDRERALLRIQDELQTRTYRPGPYRTFHVAEPKRRLISAAPYRDRVVHHALINVIGPLFEMNFVSDSYANRVDKGTHAAVDRGQAFMRRFKYVMQCDVVKFFPSIDHAILKQLLRSRIRDLDVLWLCDSIIDASNDQERVTQHFPGDARQRMTSFLATLRLRIHENRAQVRPTYRPARFLGYRCWPTHRFLTKEGIRRFRRRGRRLQRLYEMGRVDWDYVKPRLASWTAHAATASSRAVIRRVLTELVFARKGPG